MFQFLEGCLFAKAKRNLNIAVFLYKRDINCCLFGPLWLMGGDSNQKLPSASEKIGKLVFMSY